MCSSIDLQELSLVEQVVASVSELNGGGGLRRSRRADKEEEVEEDDVDLSLNALLRFGRQITLGMVCNLAANSRLANNISF